MSAAWYPVIDYSLCTECGACIDLCCKGVYDLKKSPVPVVMRPEGCVQGCRGCGSRCPVGAISYVGDIGAVSSCSCGCGSGSGKAGNCC